MTRPVFRSPFPPAFMAAAATALHEQKLKRNCTHKHCCSLQLSQS